MTRGDIQVSRELHIPAPEGHAVYAQNPSYASREGCALVEGVKHEAMRVDPDGRHRFFHARLYRRRSEDGGRAWADEPDLSRESASDLDGVKRCVPMHVLDPNRGALICLHATYEVDTREGMFELGSRIQRTYRIWYELSFDRGRTWSPARQVIDHRAGYDGVHWGPGLRYGETGGMADLLAWTFTEDGTLVFGLTTLNVPVTDGQGREKRVYGTTYVQARWHAEGTDLRFTVGDTIRLTPEQSPAGCCEPALAWLGGQRLFNTMRCQGHQASGIYATRYSTVSEDGGMTWSRPEPLRYDDGDVVWTPASFSQFVRFAKTGRTFWLANILPGPVHAQVPRYPLCIAEFDAARRCILKDSVRVIQDLPEGAPKERRYTNWGSYEERETGDLILTMPEQPKHTEFSAMTRPEDFTADCIRYRVRFC